MTNAQSLHSLPNAAEGRPDEPPSSTSLPASGTRLTWEELTNEVLSLRARMSTVLEKSGSTSNSYPTASEPSPQIENTLMGIDRWITERLQRLKPFYERGQDYEQLEEYFMNFEEEMKRAGIPQARWYDVLADLIPEDPRCIHLGPYKDSGGGPDYEQFRNWVLQQASDGIQDAYLVEKVFHIPEELLPMQPSDLEAYLNHLRILYRRCIRRTGRPEFLTENMIAYCFVKHLPAACRSYIRGHVRRYDAPGVYAVVKDLAADWERSQVAEKRESQTAKRQIQGARGVEDSGDEKRRKFGSPTPRFNPSDRRGGRSGWGQTTRRVSMQARPQQPHPAFQPRSQKGNTPQNSRGGQRHVRMQPQSFGGNQQSSPQQPQNAGNLAPNGQGRPPPVCYGCQQPGHYKQNCPLFANHVEQIANSNPTPPENTPMPKQQTPRQVSMGRRQVVSHVTAGPSSGPEPCLSSSKKGSSKTQLGGESKDREIRKVLGTLIWEGVSAVSTAILVDTGAAPNLILRDMIPRDVQIQPLKGPVNLQGPDGTGIDVLGEVEAIVRLGSFTSRTNFYVVPYLSCQVLLGMEYIEEHGLILDFKNKCIVFSKKDNTTVPFIGFSGCSNAQACYASRAVELPARSTCLIEVQLPIKQVPKIVSSRFLEDLAHHKTFWVHATLHQKGLAIPNCLTRGFLEVTNLNQHPVKLEIDYPLATCSPVGESSLQPFETVLRNLLERLDYAADDADVVESINSVVEGQKGPMLPDMTEAEQQLGSETAEKLRKLCVEYSDLFSDGSEEVTATTVFTAPVETAEGVVVCKPPYRQSREQREETKKLVEDMLKKGIISRSTSPWASPITLVRKKDGTARFCVDFREVNKCLSVPKYPLPRIDDVLQCFEGKKFFSVFDLVSGFWQIPIKKEDRHKTAFVTSDGLFEFNRLPFGLASSPAYFQQLMDVVIRGLKWTCAIAYIDDIIIFSETLEDHLKDLRRLFTALRAANLKLSPKKCVLGAARVHYLGHVISRDGIEPNPAKTRAIEEYKRPGNVTQLRRFLGLAQYYRRFIKNFSRAAAPLFALMKKDSKFNWGPECEEAFQQLKTALMSSPVLAHPDLSKPFIVECDASSSGFGAILIQKDSEDQERVIAYASRSLTPCQKRWTATELEAGALIYALETFRTYLLGNKTIVRTDHSPLPWLKQNKDKTYKLTRWVLRLQEFDIEIQHKPGRRMPHVDALSRAPIDDKTTPDELDVFPDRIVLTVTEDINGKESNFEEVKPLGAVKHASEKQLSLTAAQKSKRDGGGGIRPQVTRDSDKFPVLNVQNGDLEQAERETAASASEETFLEDQVVDSAPEVSHHAPSELISAQANDPFCQKIREILTLNEDERPSWCAKLRPFVENGLLLVHFEGSKPVVLLPESLKDRVIFNHHLSYYAGHFGMKKTLNRIKLYYYWPRMKRHVKRFISRCMFCLTYKPQFTVPKWLKLPIGTPFEILAMDLYGPLPMTLHRHEYVLVLVDHHTRWCELAPLRQTTVEAVATALHTYWFSRYGIPRVLLSDNGPQFTAALLTQLCKVYGIRQVHSSPYHPRGNSVVESYMRSLNIALNLVHVVGERRWDELLPAAAMAYRTAPHSSTGFSPFFLVTGTEAVLPLSREWNEPTFGASGLFWLQALWKCRHALIKNHFEELKRRKSLNKENPFPDGSWVGIKIPQAGLSVDGGSSKFAKKYSGPHKIIRRLPNGVTYEVRDLATGISKKVNRNNLKLFDLPSETSPAFPSVPRCLLGVPSITDSALVSSREIENLRADLPRVAETPLMPLSESLPPMTMQDDVPQQPDVLSQEQGAVYDQAGQERSTQQQQNIGSSRSRGSRTKAACLPTPVNSRPMRATLARRARAGDPTAAYRFTTL